MKYAKVSPEGYFDMDVNVDLILKGYDTFAFVKTLFYISLDMGVYGILKRRMLFFSQYQRGLDQTSDKPVRRYGILSRRGIVELLLSILVCGRWSFR